MYQIRAKQDECQYSIHSVWQLKKPLGPVLLTEHKLASLTNVNYENVLLHKKSLKGLTGGPAAQRDAWY